MTVTPINPRTLAISAACYLYNWATLEFPGTTRAHPSREVYVFPSRQTPKALPVLDPFSFPQVVRWDVWQGAVVPVLLDCQFSNLKFPDLVNVLEAELRGRLLKMGLIPP